MSNKILQVWLPLILSICMVAGMFIGYRIKGCLLYTSDAADE